MRRFLKQFLIAAPLLAVLGGCEAADVTAPVAPATTPNYDWTMPWGTGSVTLIKDPLWLLQFTNSEVIGAAGGKVSLGFHELIVPRGAVSAATKFTMSARFGGVIAVDLTAVDVRTGQRVSQFPVELQLRLSYWLLPIPRSELHNVKVYWLKDGTLTGEAVAMRTTYRAGENYIVGWLPHFSVFAMGME